MVPNAMPVNKDPSNSSEHFFHPKQAEFRQSQAKLPHTNVTFFIMASRSGLLKQSVDSA